MIHIVVLYTLYFKLKGCIPVMIRGTHLELSGCSSKFDKISIVVNLVSAAVPAPQHQMFSVMWGYSPSHPICKSIWVINQNIPIPIGVGQLHIPAFKQPSFHALLFWSHQLGNIQAPSGNNEIWSKHCSHCSRRDICPVWSGESNHCKEGRCETHCNTASGKKKYTLNMHYCKAHLRVVWIES